MKSTNTSSGGQLFMLFTVIITWFALGLQLYLLVSNIPGNGLTPLLAIARFFLFFTVLTNLLVAVNLSSVLFSPESKAGHYFSRPSVAAATALYIFIVGLVYNLVLRSTWHPTGLQKLADELLHVVVPVLYLFYWVIWAFKARLPWSEALYWLVYPALYLLYALARGAMGDIYPYPFIDLRQLTYGQVALNVLLMLVAFLGVGLLMVAVSRQLQNKADR